MQSFKPEMDIREAEAFLRGAWSGQVSDVQPIDQGELCRVYRFLDGASGYVVHFSGDGERAEKEKFLYDALSPAGVPIPKIVDAGRAGALYYSIAEQAAGQSIARCPEAEQQRAMPDLVERFATMNLIRIAGTCGYGWIGPTGDGSHASWADFLASFFQEEQTGFWRDWHALFADSFLERGLYEELYGEMMDLVRHSPAERYLVHGDFHLGNMLADGPAVTGIVDWEMAMYGDFVFDLATQQLWHPQLRFPERVREAWAREGRDIPKLGERLRCALLFKGLDGLRFYAKQNHREGYELVKRGLLARGG
ncbi:phosphotransferase family protein [Cohnella nanjingensis]|uniref:Aminoglycoside phosphotransferase family protein n=1 Tax=Cohnella nanjingensis TaxID=1387779 RepID=A0A7X0RP86_9BACL|nr:aminoglycoside phosphotransferase family protein [Cohnella nanjingensis]MBB6671172.1 aminoglycoside phosphotransferase family protein [Cohnella nanjingensis]